MMLNNVMMEMQKMEMVAVQHANMNQILAVANSIIILLIPILNAFILEQSLSKLFG